MPSVRVLVSLLPGFLILFGCSALRLREPLAAGRPAADTCNSHLLGRCSMSGVFLLTVYCALIVLASLAGGWIPLLFQLTHRQMQVAVSFVAGVILGVGLLHLLPHSFEQLQSIGSHAS